MSHPPKLQSFKIRKKSNRISSKWFFGLEFDRRTNILSLAAFLLSIIGVSGQLYFFFQGPVISLQPTEQVVFYGELYPDEEKYLHISSRMAYVNTGQPGYNDAVKRETVVLYIGRKTYSFLWSKFINSDNHGSVFEENPLTDARPVAIGAGSVEAHETSFAPIINLNDKANTYVNFLKFTEFKELALDEKEIVVSIQYETFSGKTGIVSCKVLIDSSFREYIAHGWIGPQCV